MRRALNAKSSSIPPRVHVVESGWSGEGDGVGRELGGLRRAHRRSAAGPARHRLRAARPFRGLLGRPRLRVHVKKVRRAPLGYPARAAPRRPSRAPSPQGAAGGIRRGRPRGPHRVEARKARSPGRERDRNRQSGSDRAVVSPIRRARRGSSSLRGSRRLSYHARGSRSGDSRIRPAARRGSLTSAWPCGRTGGAGIPGGRCRCCRLVSGGRCGRTGGAGIPGWRGDAATRRRRRMAAERGSHDPDRRRPFHRASAAGRPS